MRFQSDIHTLFSKFQKDGKLRSIPYPLILMTNFGHYL